MWPNGRLLFPGPIEPPLKSKGPESLPALSWTCRRFAGGLRRTSRSSGPSVLLLLLRFLLRLLTDRELALDVLDARGLLRELDRLVDLRLALHVLARQIDHAVAGIDVDLQAANRRISQQFRLDGRRNRGVVHHLAHRP